MYWLEDHLEEGSFKTCYSDTDSMAIALTKSGPEGGDDEQQLRALFDPLVKPAKRDSWERTWKDWFVTTNQTWDIRKPGKLKGMCTTVYGFIHVCTCIFMCTCVCKHVYNNLFSRVLLSKGAILGTVSEVLLGLQRRHEGDQNWDERSVNSWS